MQTLVSSTWENVTPRPGVWNWQAPFLQPERNLEFPCKPPFLPPPTTCPGRRESLCGADPQSTALGQQPASLGGPQAVRPASLRSAFLLRPRRRHPQMWGLPLAVLCPSPREALQACPVKSPSHPPALSWTSLHVRALDFPSCVVSVLSSAREGCVACTQ